MSIEPARRRRRDPEDVRADALAAARTLLLESGPDAVTLKAVAGALGMSHGNLIHRFGSAAALQSALMASMVAELGDAIGATAKAWRRAGGALPADLVDPVFRAFDEGGGARLAAHLALSGDLSHLEPVRASLQELTASLAALFPDAPEARRSVSRAVLLTTLMAFGDALIGEPLRDMLELEADDARAVTRGVLASRVGGG